MADLTLQVISSSVGLPDGLLRTGYYLLLRDSFSRNFMVGIASDRVHLMNDSSSYQFNEFLMDTTDQFHNYQLAVSNTGAVLSVDGVQRLTQGLGPQESGFSEVRFGALTDTQSSETLLNGVTVTTVPEPSSALLLLSGVRLLVRRAA